MLKVRIQLYGAGPFNNAIIKCPVPVMLEAKVLPFILAFWCIMAPSIQIYFNIFSSKPFSCFG